ncbi:hypothetical protein AVEN_115170-1 [Araneus ventricosus]|uniref:Uncharacterized protein n=1 Tax=Araneus ventricosus TaxID=182803 RepID=A0A4Y1ZYC3_ARAVE|nr:hypothetical protein AVEN_115170-1 [Araneus ventricosus]
MRAIWDDLSGDDLLIWKVTGEDSPGGPASPTAAARFSHCRHPCWKHPPGSQNLVELPSRWCSVQQLSCGQGDENESLVVKVGGTRMASIN